MSSSCGRSAYKRGWRDSDSGECIEDLQVGRNQGHSQISPGRKDTIVGRIAGFRREAQHMVGDGTVLVSGQPPLDFFDVV